MFTLWWFWQVFNMSWNVFSTHLEIFKMFSTHLEICYQHTFKFSTQFSTWFMRFQNCTFDIFHNFNARSSLTVVFLSRILHNFLDGYSYNLSANVSNFQVWILLKTCWKLCWKFQHMLKSVMHVENYVENFNMCWKCV